VSTEIAAFDEDFPPRYTMVLCTSGRAMKALIYWPAESRNSSI
jgi:hypothetical protein